MGVQAYIPKGTEDEDGDPDANDVSHVFRKAGDLRPITLKNDDAKACNATIARAYRPTMKASTSKFQRGFKPGAQITQNCVELDLESRIHAIRCMSQRNAKSPETMLPGHSIAKISCLVLFDYAAAFPSVIHMWVRMVLHAVQAPTALIYAFEHIYFSNIAIMKANGTFMEMFDVTRGVLQGDPLSAMFFNLAIDPLLWAFSKIVINPGLGTILACADDIGAALQELNTLKAISKVFKTFQRISGLGLKPSKCL